MSCSALLCLAVLLSVACVDPTSASTGSCAEIIFITTIRTSEYFIDDMSSRQGVLSFRVFRDNLLAHNDLVAAVVVDSPLTKQEKTFLLSDLRSYEIRFVFFPASAGGRDLTPNYQYALRAFWSMGIQQTCGVLYITSSSLFLQDPSDLISSVVQSNDAPTTGMLCVRHSYRVERRVVDDFVAIAGLSPETLALARETKYRTYYPIFCNPDMLFFSNMIVIPLLLDASEAITSAQYFHTQYQTTSDGRDDAFIDGRHQHDSILLHIALLSIFETKNLRSIVGELPSLTGADLSEVRQSLNTDGSLVQLFILLSPHMIESRERVKILFTSSASDQTCIADVSRWSLLSISLRTDKYSVLAEAAMSRIGSTPYACQLLANAFSAVPFADYLEFGSRAVADVARPWHFGHSVGNNVNVSGTGDSVVSYTEGLHELVESIGLRGASMVHFRSPHQDIEAVCIDAGNSEAASCGRNSPGLLMADKWLEDFILYYESFPHSQAHLIQRRPPCVVWLETADISGVNFCHAMLDKYKSRLYLLGFIPFIQLCDDNPHELVVIGPHCPHRHFERVKLLAPLRVAEELCNNDKRQDYTNNYHIAENEIESVALERSNKPPIGILVADVPGHEFKVLEDPIPPQLVDLLVGRLLHKTVVQKDTGANSYFINFDSSKPRSLVEAYILDYLAPLVVGVPSEARRHGFIGAEWWVQQRAEDDPKEYHLDTAITWCRDNGWPPELLNACFFYPAIGSITYLSDEGGPTAVFNQTPGMHGMSPILPSEVALVFPKKNRLMIFNGAKFHGVMRKKPCVPVSKRTGASTDTCLPRVTLLVNFWRDKTAGEGYTTTTPQEQDYLRHYYYLKRNIPHVQHLRDSSLWSSPEAIEFQRQFSDDFLSWKHNEVPDAIMERIAHTYEGFHYHDGKRLYHHKKTTAWELPKCNISAFSPAPTVLLKLNPSEVVQNFVDSSGQHFHHWPQWEVVNGILQLYNVNATADALDAWKRSMPGA